VRFPSLFILPFALVACLGASPETPDYCGLLLGYWGVRAVECQGDCNPRNAILITRRNNVQTEDGQSALGVARGSFIEIDKNRALDEQLPILLHELGHVLLGPTHSEDPADLMYPYYDPSTRIPSAREFLLARELYAGRVVQCRFIP
jgi:hypothetical protein